MERTSLLQNGGNIDNSYGFKIDRTASPKQIEAARQSDTSSSSCWTKRIYDLYIIMLTGFLPLVPFWILIVFLIVPLR